MTADFNGMTAIIVGGNNKGKSSFLKSLPDRLRGTKPEMILKQGEKDGFAELELTTGEKFVWSFDSKKEKLTFISERNIPQSVTKDLCRAYFPPVFDVDEFLNSTPAKQKATLQKLTGIDFTEIDRIYKDAYDSRTYANKRVVEEKAKLGFVDPALPNQEESTEELEAELSGIDLHNTNFNFVAKGISEREKVQLNNDADILDLKAKIAAIEERNEKLSAEITAGKIWMADDVNKPKTNQDELKSQIAAIKETNKAIAENNQSIKQQKVYDTAVKNAAQADAEVKRIEKEKVDVIKHASMPEGFGFSEDGITYNGYAFNKEQLSSSGIYIAALKLAAIGLGDVKTLHFDASFLDKNSLTEIEQWANENGLQLLIERPDWDGGEIEYQILQHTNGVAVA